MDRVDDAIVADADAVGGPTSECPGSGRTRILGEEGDRPLDAGSDVRMELSECPERGWADLDPVAAHDQPSSAFTSSQGMFGPSSAIAASKAATSSASSAAATSSS